MSDSYEYETKCRRCGKFTSWFFSLKTSFTWLEFVQAIIDMIVSPRQFDCDTCEKKTVQDVVSYTE